MQIDFNEEFLEAFKKTFRGRTDVVPHRYLNRKIGRYVYAPLTDRDGNRLPFNDEMLRDHFGARVHLGVYPLLDDNMCHWLAADFDDHDPDDETVQRDPLADIIKYYEQAQMYNIPMYVLRSQSGNGFHAYIFFAEPVAAYEARLIGEFLQDEAKLLTFDRFFPSQDILGVTKDPTKPKIGNLIALPFHGDRVLKDNTVFLDPVSGFTLPYKNQLEFLLTLRRMTKPEIDACITMNDLHKRRSINTSSANANIVTSDEVKEKILMCDFMRGMYENRGNYTVQRNLQWRAMLSNLWGLKHGLDLAIEFSGSGGKYSGKDIVFAEIEKLQRHGPITCAKIKEQQEENKHGTWAHCQFCQKDCKVGAPIGLVDKNRDPGKENPTEAIQDFISKLFDGRTFYYIMHMYFSGRMATEESNMIKLDLTLRNIILSVVPDSPLVFSGKRDKYIARMKKHLAVLEPKMTILNEVICAHDSHIGMLKYNRLAQIIKDAQVAKYITETRLDYMQNQDFVVGDVTNQLGQFEHICRSQYISAEFTKNLIKSKEEMHPGEYFEKYKSLLKLGYEHLLEIPSGDAPEKESVITPDMLEKIKENLIESNRVRYDTGYNFMKKFDSGTLHMVAAPSNNGKSVYLANVAVNFARSNQDKFKEFPDDMSPLIIYISTEDSVQDSMARLATIIENGAQDVFYKDPCKAAEVVNDFSLKYNVNFYVKYLSNFNAVDLDRIRCELEASKWKTVLLVLDYIDYMDSISKSDDLYAKQGECTKNLRAIANQWEIPVMTATQTNRFGFDKKKTMDENVMADSSQKNMFAHSTYYLRFNEDPSNRVPDGNQCTDMGIRCGKAKTAEYGAEIVLMFSYESLRITEKNNDHRYNRGVMKPDYWDESFLKGESVQKIPECFIEDPITYN